MKGTFRARDVRALAAALGASSMLAVVGPGCASSPASSSGAAAAPAKQAAAPKQEPRKKAAVSVAEREQRDAQRAWCTYLQALYIRAAEGADRWPRYDQCLEARTMAAPRMLQMTADCSLSALQQFQGDPFTVEYAAEVSRCGADALETSAAAAPDLVPYVAAICGRVAACEDVDYSECRASLEEGLGPHLQRAVGAMNDRGRDQLRACFSVVGCDDIGSQITACIEPLLDSLLWLPG